MQSATPDIVFVDGDWDEKDRGKRERAELLTRAGRGAAAKAAAAGETVAEKQPRTLKSAPKKTKTGVELPVISESVDGLLLQTLATVSSKMYEESLMTVYEPEDGAMSMEADGALILFREALKPYGAVMDGSVLDWHGKSEAAIPPFVALVVKPENGAPILILAWRGSVKALDWINDAAFSPTLSTRWSGETKDIHAHGAYVNLVEHTLSSHEDAIVDLIEKHKVERAFFTGHSLAGGMANIAHLVVRGQLKKAGSPWARLDGRVTWLACTFAAPQTIVRLYKSAEDKPQLIIDLDESSYNVVYGCDAVPRAPAMLNFIGELMETVVPKVIADKIPAWGILKWSFRAEKKAGAAVDGAISRLEKDGLVEVMSHFTHLGAVVYKGPTDLAFKHYGPGRAAIRDKLDVKDKDFHQLLGEPDDPEEYVEALSDAHSYFHKFAFGYVK